MTRRSFFSLTPILAFAIAPLTASSAKAQGSPGGLPGTMVTSSRGKIKSKVRTGYSLTMNTIVPIIASPYVTTNLTDGSVELIPTVSGSHDAVYRITQIWDLNLNSGEEEEDDDGIAPPIPAIDYAFAIVYAAANVNSAGESATANTVMSVPTSKTANASASYPDKLNDSKNDNYFELLTSPKPAFVTFKGTISLNVVKP